MRAFLPLLPLAYAGGLIVALYSAFDAYIFFFFLSQVWLTFQRGKKEFFSEFLSVFPTFFYSCHWNCQYLYTVAAKREFFAQQKNKEQSIDAFFFYGTGMQFL